jgi:hypothetical protein
MDQQEREYQVYTRRRRSTGSTHQYYRRRIEQERAAADGLHLLGQELVYSSVMGLPAPTAEPRPGIPIMHELPRRVNGMHHRLAAFEDIQRTTYNAAYHDHVFPQMVPERLVPGIRAASALCKIKKIIDYVMNKLKKKKDKKHVTWADQE